VRHADTEPGLAGALSAQIVELKKQHRKEIAALNGLLATSGG